nr:hypothetical protein [Tanacetum cinerariifolium]
MEELLQAPTDGVGDAIVVPPVLASQFKLKIGLLNLVTAISFHDFENNDPHSHIRRFTKITQMIKLNQVPHDIIKLILFSFSLEGAARTWLEKEPPNSITTWNDLVSNAFPYGFINEEVYVAQPSGFIDFTKPNHVYKLKKALHGLKQALKAWEEIKVITTRSGIVLAGPSVPPPPLSSSFKEVERDLEMKTRSSELPPSPVSRSSELTQQNPHQPPIPYPSRLNKEKLQDKSDIQIHKFLQMFKKLHINISLAKALLLCQTVLPEKLPKKLRDPGNFSFPMTFLSLRNVWHYLGVSINLMPFSVWKKLMLPKLVPTRMTLELANRYGAYPADIAEDVFVPVGKFTFPADFVFVFSLPRHTQYVLSKQRSMLVLLVFNQTITFVFDSINTRNYKVVGSDRTTKTLKGVWFNCTTREGENRKPKKVLRTGRTNESTKGF